jgi:uncharacterized protein
MPTIFELIDADDSDGVRALLESDPSVARTRDEGGLSPLVRAAYRGRGRVFDAILAAGPPTDPWDRLVAGESDGLPSIDAWSPDGFTPLHLAAFAHNAAATRALLAAGADPDVLSRASFAQVTPLGTAAFAGAVDVARVLIDHGADRTIAGAGGGTPLDTARANGHAELVALLG